MRTRSRMVAVAMGLSLSGGLLGACGNGSSHSASAGTSGTGTQSATTCKSPDSLTFRLNWVQDYEQVPYYVALNNGYYKSQCLNVTIQPGRGSADTVTIVGSGTAQMGVADTVAIIQGQAKGIPVTGVGVDWRKNAFAIVVRKSALHGVTNPTPSDLYGLTFGAVTAGSPYIFWKAFVGEQHLDASKIKTVALAPPGYAEMVEGKVDFLANFASAATDLESKGVPVVTLKGADFGQQAYGLGFLANSSWLAGHGQDVKRFLTATGQAMTWSAKHPSQALAIEAKYNPALTATPSATKANLAGFSTDSALWSADSSNGLGTYFDFTDTGINQSEQILYQGGVLTGKPVDVTSQWTTQYIPAPSAYENQP